MVFTANVFDTALLPFEVQLCEIAGLTEAEYRHFRNEAIKRSGVRPAGYEHIPDIKAELTTVVAGKTVLTALGQIVLGLTLTAASILLAPKPPKPESASRRQLGGINQAGRFTPTHGFDSTAEIATYGQPIPIVFARYNETDKTGGALVSPVLAWSRMFSYGTQQSIKQLWIVSEQGHESISDTMGLDAPDLSGVFVGNGNLKTIYDQQFCLYWKRNTRNDAFRIRRGTEQGQQNNKLYGTNGDRWSGDPMPNHQNDVFHCELGSDTLTNAFSETHSLSNNTQFGCFAPIANGNDYRVNWRIFPILDVEGEDDPGDLMLWERVKVCGSTKADGIKNSMFRDRDRSRGFQQPDPQARGMDGIGRAYSRRMGIVRLTTKDGTVHTASESERFKQVTADEGSEIQFKITSGAAKIPDDFYAGGKVKTDDINSIIDNFRTNADDALQLGEIFQIGRTWWQVTHRSLDDGNDPTVWKAGIGKEQIVTLKCIDDDKSGPLTSNAIGIVNEQKILAPSDHFIGDLPYESSPHCNFFPLLRSAQATVTNTRECDATEIGIKSVIYTELAGLCAFQTLPTPAELWEADRNRQALESGVNNLMIKKASMFYILIRPVGVDESGTEFEWKQLDLPFAIVGNSSVAKYNWIRIVPPIKKAYEYKFRPMTGASISINNDAKEFLVLNASTGPAFSKIVPVSGETSQGYGNFSIVTKGELIRKGDLERNLEFSSKGIDIPTQYVGTKPSFVTRNGYRPEVFGMAHIWRAELFGDPRNLAPGTTKSVNLQVSQGGSKQISVDITATTFELLEDAPWNGSSIYRPNLIGKCSWGPEQITVVTSGTGTTTNWNEGDTFFKTLTLSQFNKDSFAKEMYDKEGEGDITCTFKCGPRAPVESSEPTRYAARLFEDETQYADLSSYGDNVRRSNSDGPESTITYVNEIVENQDDTATYKGMTISGLSLKAGRNYSNLDQLRFWLKSGIPVKRLHPDDSDSVGPSDLFTDLVYFLLTDRTAGAGRLLDIEATDDDPDLIDKDALRETSKFLRTNKLTYNGVLGNPSNVREFVSSLAPSYLCNFVLSNGKFSLKPALPTDNSGAISTGPVTIKQLFTAGNIIQDSFSVNYIPAEERQPFKVHVRYRKEVRNQLPVERTVGAYLQSATDPSYLPIESYDLTAHCTNSHHARLVAKYFLSARERITHGITFKTSPYGISLAPGDLIRCVTEFLPYSSANNGVVTEEGELISVSTIADGSYTVLYYKPDLGTTVQEGTLTVSNGAVGDSTMYGSVFTVYDNSSTEQNVYRVEQLTIDSDNMVEVSASEFPCTGSLTSLIAQDVLDASNTTYTFDYDLNS